MGRNDNNVKVILPKTDIPLFNEINTLKPIEPGDYVAVTINDANSQILKGTPLYHTTLEDFSRNEDTKSYVNNFIEK